MSAWAAVRIHKYQIESMSLILLDDPDQMMNLAQQEQSALAEEISDILISTSLYNNLSLIIYVPRSRYHFL